MRYSAWFGVCCVLALLPVVGRSTDATDISSWYAFQPRNTPEPGEIGMQDWLSKPAGQYGRVTREQDKLYYNGKSIKLWGINLCYATCAPEQALADKRAAFYPKYGINSVRLHKYVDGPGWSGIQSKESCVEFDPAGLDRMDYQVAKLRKRAFTCCSRPISAP